MSNSDKPTILIIPGAFATPDLYDEVVNPLAAQGYSIRALHLPSVGYAQERPGTMMDDAAFIASEVSKLADEGKDVVLIAHSYGGVPATQSTKGVGKVERQSQEKKGGIVRLAYMTAMVPALEESPSRNLLLELPPKEHMMEIREEDGWLYQSDISDAAEIVFSDLPREEGEAWAKRSSRHSANCFPAELTHAGYKDIAVSYLVCEDDLALPRSHQRAYITMVERDSGQKVDVTSIKAGHAPIASQPEAVVDWILDVVGKV